MSYEVTLYDIGSRTNVRIDLYERNIFTNVHTVFEIANVMGPLVKNNNGYAEDLVPYLENGLCHLLCNEDKVIEQLQPVGYVSAEKLYGYAVEFIKRLLKACRQYPSAFYTFTS